MSDVDVLNQDNKINVPLHSSVCEPDADQEECVQCPIVVVEAETGWDYVGWDYVGSQRDRGGKQRYSFRRSYTTAIGLAIRRPLPKCIDEEFVKQGLGASKTGYKRV